MEYTFTISGSRDLIYAIYPDEKKCVSSTQVFLNGATMLMKSLTQEVVAL